MPLHLTEQVRERARRRPPDDAWCAFADLFHHRTACLLYRAWSEAEPAVGADRASPGPWGEPDDPFGARLAALGGARPSDRPIHAPDGAGGRSGSDGESGGESEGESDGEGAGPGDRKGDRDGTPSSLALSPMLAAWPAAGARSADAIEQVASAVLGDRVRVRAPVVQWLSVPQGERCRLGHPGRASQLGGGAVLGARLRDAASTVRIEVGPVTPARWRQLREPAGRRAGGASGGASGGAWASPAARLRLCVRRLVDPRLVVDLRVRLAASDVPEARLSRHDADGPRLGRSAWLSRRASHDADDLRWRLR